jgi:hypothetical protein
MDIDCRKKVNQRHSDDVVFLFHDSRWSMRGYNDARDLVSDVEGRAFFVRAYNGGLITSKKWNGA